MERRSRDFRHNCGSFPLALGWRKTTAGVDGRTRIGIRSVISLFPQGSFARQGGGGEPGWATPVLLAGSIDYCRDAAWADLRTLANAGGFLLVPSYTGRATLMAALGSVPFSYLGARIAIRTRQVRLERWYGLALTTLGAFFLFQTVMEKYYLFFAAINAQYAKQPKPACRSPTGKPTSLVNDATTRSAADLPLQS